MSNEIFENTPESTALAAVSTGEIAQWSDDRRKDFVQTFSQRTEASAEILRMTAVEILQTGIRRHFVSVVEAEKLQGGIRGLHYRAYGSTYEGLTGRSQADLVSVAKERAEVVLRELPQLKKAVDIIDPETGKKLVQLEKLRNEGKALKAKLDEHSEPIRMSDLDQDMTIGDFRALVKKTAKEREKLINDLNVLTKEGQELEDQVARKLYKGLPGLSEAVLKLAKAHIDRAAALEPLKRRVHEAVMFGDSESAMTMLASFEKDEPDLTKVACAEFKEALQKLKDAAKPTSTSKKPKALKKG